jgi:TRAP-type C4-dicarboxylate transport system permease small subunit
LKRAVARVADAILLGFALTLLVLSWVWYDPIALARAGFDLDRFALETFKFIYTEPTSTIGVPKFWLWLAVPLMSIGMSIHALANLLEGPPDEGAGSDALSRPLGEA